MILAMTLFFLVLAVLGGFMIVLSHSNARAARRVPLAFSMLFAGIGYCCLALVLYPLAFYLGAVWGFVLLFFAPFVGGLIGAIFGYRTGLKRIVNNRSVAETEEAKGGEYL
jgi:drug/metabolite transporter (DMT)-like permease